MKTESIYFQAIVNEVDFPYLYDFLKREYAGENTVRGSAKRFVCKTVEDFLEAQDRKKEESQEHAELIQRLDEIRQMLRSGVRVPSETVEELKQESSRVKDSLRALMA